MCVHSHQVEKGVNTVIGVTNKVVSGAELAINEISCGINTAMNSRNSCENTVPDSD